ncbi:hypothetical protein GCM10007886_35530 [Methylobacterium gregans]|nr:hypothetical protein GCM10007886_35530 [Methylobacterium gregans]
MDHAPSDNKRDHIAVSAPIEWEIARGRDRWWEGGILEGSRRFPPDPGPARLRFPGAGPGQARDRAGSGDPRHPTWILRKLRQ